VRPGDPEVLKDEKIKAIGAKYKKSVAQVVLRWHYQRGIACCPKSVTPSRIRVSHGPTTR
jgi:diketogulonate reductase-like aldo/keto reductase